MDKKIDLKILNETIDDLRNNPDACTKVEGKNKDDYFIMPYSNPGEKLRNFIQYFYDNGLVDSNYGENYRIFKDKQVDEYSYDELLSAITEIIRSDRYASCYLYDCVKNGRLLMILERLKLLLER